MKENKKHPAQARPAQTWHEHNEYGFFRRCAHTISEASGSSWSFGLALLVILVWSATGPFFHFSDTWQLVVNTGTTIVTFLMVFLIQNTQNRDTKAIHLKLDELLRGVTGARTGFVNLEELTDAELERLKKEFERLRIKAAKTQKEISSSRR
jgi:low affinity Fe/Cu permease